MFSHRVFLLIAILATVVVLGCWDNKRELERVLGEGYATTAQITGAQYQRKLPFAVDGWRPRFVEQDLSVDLKWQGRDGKEYERRKVPVTEQFARTIVDGEQVRLAVVPVQLLDDDRNVPALLADASPRLASLATWTSMSGYIALTGWVGYALLSVWSRRRAQARHRGNTIVTTPVPMGRTVVGLGLFCAGGFLAFQAWESSQPAGGQIAGGQEAIAEIVSISTRSAGGGAREHVVQLAWKDMQGTVHRYGPVPISATYWAQITKDGELRVKETRIRYRDGSPPPRPVVLADHAEPGFWAKAGLTAGAVLLVIGAGLLFSALRILVRTP